MIMLLTGDETRDAECILNFKLSQDSATTHNAESILTMLIDAKPSWAENEFSTRHSTNDTSPIAISNDTDHHFDRFLNRF